MLPIAPAHRCLTSLLALAGLLIGGPVLAAPLPVTASAQHPSLLFTPKSLADLKQRIPTSPRLKQYLDSLIARVDPTLDKPADLPPRGANWFHWYVCPQHGNRLTLGKSIGPWKWEHICPVDKHAFLGDPAAPATDFDGCALAGIHGGNAQLILNSALLYQLTGKKTYADKAAQVLAAYANKYADYPLHTTQNKPNIGGGKVGCQTLDESVWLIPVCQGFDLVWDTLTPDDRQTIITKLLIPAAKEVILPHKMGVHNIQCWKNSAVGLVGLLLGDSQLISAAIDDPKSGYRVQMEKGVQGDGPWWEGAWGYHFYTVSAVWPLTEAARNLGIDLYGPAYKSMFDAPLNFAMPNMVLPAFNDSGEVNLGGSSSVYELAYARYKDARYLQLLSGNRQNNLAMFFGVEPLPPATPRAAASANYPVSGYGILTRGTGRQATWLCLKYGPHGGGHGHPDKLNFVLYARGQVLAPDPGTTGYGSPLQKGWFRTTVAHNTLTVDEKDQTAAEGKCLAFGSQGGVDFVMAQAGAIAKGVGFVRGVAMFNENLVVFIDQISDRNSSHTLDIAYHQNGAWDNLPAGQAWTVPAKPGYQQMAGAVALNAQELVNLHIKMNPTWKTALTIAAQPDTQVIAGTGMGGNTAQRLPMALIRRQGQNLSVAWSIALDDRAPRLQLLPVTDDQGTTLPAWRATVVQVTIDGKTRYLLANPDKRPVKIILPDGSSWTSAEAFAVKD